MNRDKLRAAEANFLLRYPEGFADPAMQAVKKKHNVDRLVEFTQANLTRANCNQAGFVCDTLITIIGRSSLVSRFEKPRFKEFIGSLDSDEKEALAYAVEQRLHGRKQRGFEAILGMLMHHKLAKWAVISAVPFYYAPTREAFIKPTTTKEILTALEIPHLQYRPTPAWDFYQGYRDLLAEIRKAVNPSLSPNNAALTGFLMMSL